MTEVAAGDIHLSSRSIVHTRSFGAEISALSASVTSMCILFLFQNGLRDNTAFNTEY